LNPDSCFFANNQQKQELITETTIENDGILVDFSDSDLQSYEQLSASEMAELVLIMDRNNKSVIWDQILQTDTAIGTFEIWSVIIWLN